MAFSSSETFNRQRRQRLPAPATVSQGGRVMPHSLEAEENLLSCCMLDGADVIARAYAKGVREGSFYDPNHGAVWAVLERLWLKKLPTEPSCVAELLKEEKRLDQVGGYAFLAQVTKLVPTTAQAGFFIDRVIEHAEVREIIREAEAAAARCYAYSGGELGHDEGIVGALDRLQGLRVRSERDLPPIMTDKQFEAAVMPIPPELVKGVMHRGRRTLIAAPSKASKTFLAMSLSICIAKGAPWLGFATTAAPVLHIDFELPSWGLKDRRRAICQHLGITGELNVEWWSLDGYQRSIDELLPLITARAPLGKFGLIVLEPAYVIMGERDENANADVTDFMNKLAWLGRMTGAAVLCAHHFAKGDAGKKDAKDRASGAAAWIRAPDTAIVMTPLDEEQGENCYRMEFIERNMKPHAALGVCFEYPLFRLKSGLDVDALREPGRPRESRPTDVVKLLEDLKLTHGQWMKAAEKTGMSESTFKRRMKEALAEGLVTQVGTMYFRAPPIAETATPPRDCPH